MQYLFLNIFTSAGKGSNNRCSHCDTIHTAMVTFSIIVPVYNVAPYLRECLDSLLAQTFTDWECLCVNDGSTDNSGAILDEYAAKDRRFKVFHKPNGGVSSARNLALDHAQGDWFAFLDSDDLYHPDLLTHCNRALADYPTIDCIHFSCSTIRANEVPYLNKLFPSQIFIDCRNELHFDQLDCGIWEHIYRAARVNALRFPKLAIGEDWIWKMAAFEKIRSLVHLNAPLYIYRIRPGSATYSTFSTEKILQELQWTQDVWKQLKQSKKTIPLRCFRYFELLQTERFTRLLFSNSRAVQEAVWPEWMKTLRHMSTHAHTRWIRIYSTLIVRTNSPLLARILFSIPHEIKKVLCRWRALLRSRIAKTH